MTVKVEKEYMLRFLNYLNNVAYEEKTNAGYSGERYRGSLPQEIEAYRHGLNQTIPSSWEEHKQHFDITQDPEYDEYIRLKEKFKDNHQRNRMFSK